MKMWPQFLAQKCVVEEEEVGKVDDKEVRPNFEFR